MRKLLVTGDFDIDKAVFPDSIELIHIRRPIDERQILEVLPDVHDYILGGPEYLSAELIEAATRLENIVVMGTGTSSFVDVQCVTDKGIKLANTPNLNVQAVAEFTLAMIVLCSARVFESAEGVKAGNAWIQTPRRSLLNLKVGFVGMGSIAGEVAYQLHMRGSENMCYWSRNRKESLEKSLGLQYTSLGDLVNTVDVLCIHLSGCAETFNLIDESVLARASTELMILNLSNPKLSARVRSRPTSIAIRMHFVLSMAITANGWITKDNMMIPMVCSHCPQKVSGYLAFGGTGESNR